MAGMKAVGKLETLQMAAVPLLLPREPISSQKQEYFSCFCVELTGGEKSFLKLALEQKQEKLDFLGVLSVGP